jgi:hypothetical protein
MYTEVISAGSDTHPSHTPSGDQGRGALSIAGCFARSATVLAIGFVLADAVAVMAQSAIEPGDILISTTAFAPVTTSKIAVHRSDGTFKSDFTTSTSARYRETLFHNGFVFAAERGAIFRFTPTGSSLGIWTPISAPVWLAPAVDGSIVSSNGSGNLFRIGSTGSLTSSRNTGDLGEPVARGLDIAPDQCTVFYATGTRLATWDSCLNSAPVSFGAVQSHGPGTSLRLLADGRLLVSYLHEVALLAADGSELRTYGLPAAPLALDIDRRSFWVGIGSSLVKVDIETGAVLVSVDVGYQIDFLSVVGEPRASLIAAMNGSIPTLGSES